MTQNNEMTFEERMKLDRAPLPLKIYKGMGGKHGALRLSFKRPWLNDGDRKQEGVIFVEMAPATGKIVYDWEQKYRFAIGITDIGQLIHYFSSLKDYVDESNPDWAKVQIFHDKDAGTANQGKNASILSISYQSGGKGFFFAIDRLVNKKFTPGVKVPISKPEAKVMEELFKASVSAMLAWTAIGLEE